MSIIPSGTVTTPGPIVDTSAPRAVAPADTTATSAAAANAASAPAASSGPVVTATALAAGSAPIDQDRVAAIRQAIATDSYPLVPAKIGDAMIAAGLLLRMAK